MKTVSFEKALELSQGQKQRHVLLGNGFSIACRKDIFQYGRLFERAHFDSVSPRIRRAFEVLATTDFERVIRALRDLATLLDVYVPSSSSVSAEIVREAEALREVLVTTIASSHPDRPGDISSEEYQHCKRFLGHFQRIFSLNYDLLLYWTLMQSEIEPNLACDDGFRKPEDHYDASYVTWEPENTYEQNVYYLHGALHLFDAGAELQKYTWANTGIALIDQIRDALSKGFFPLFVAEGTSEEKIVRIRHSDYLAKGLRSLIPIKGALFLYGHSLADNDNHILRLIQHGRTSQLFVSLYGKPTSKSNAEIIRKAQGLALARGPKHELEVHFYDAESAEVWR